MQARLGLSGNQVTEIYGVLDGPDFACGDGVSLLALRQALQSLPAESEPVEGDACDPVGAAFAAFMECDCVLQAVSLRACALARAELRPIASALAQCPWQLRTLNLWDNRVCDYCAKILASALEEYRGLEHLTLGKNRITEVGLSALCEPFQAQVLDEEGLKAAQERKKAVDAKVEAAAKAKAKAKGKAKPDRPEEEGSRIREPPTHIEALEERPSDEDGKPSVWILRKWCCLKSLGLADNPIRSSEVVESLQPMGPKGSELMLRGTPAAACLMARRPEFRDHRIVGQSVPGTASGSGDGWRLRLS